MRKIWASLLAICIVIFCVGCSNGNSSKTDSEVASLKKQVQNLQQENSKLESELKSSSNATVNSSTVNSSLNESADTISETNNTLKLNQAVTIPDICTFSVSSFKFTNTVNPPKPDGVYNYYEIKDANDTYIDFVIKYKNLASTGEEADSAGDMKITYDNNYEYTSFSTIEAKGGGDLEYSNITEIDPLQTGIIHYICEVPKEVKNSGKSVVATLAVSGQNYQIKIK